MLFLLAQYFGASRAEKIRLTAGIVASVLTSAAAVAFLQGVAVVLTILASAVVISLAIFVRRWPERESRSREMRRPLGTRVEISDEYARQ